MAPYERCIFTDFRSKILFFTLFHPFSQCFSEVMSNFQKTSSLLCFGGFVFYSYSCTVLGIFLLFHFLKKFKIGAGGGVKTFDAVFSTKDAFLEIVDKRYYYFVLFRLFLRMLFRRSENGPIWVVKKWYLPFLPTVLVFFLNTNRRGRWGETLTVCLSPKYQVLESVGRKRLFQKGWKLAFLRSIDSFLNFTNIFAILFLKL